MGDPVTIDCGALFENCEDLASRTPSPLAAGMEGSAILAIAGQVKARIAAGVDVANFTVGCLLYTSDAADE